MKYRVGVDIGGTKANIGILDENREILAKCKIPVTSQAGCKDMLHKVNIALRDLLSGTGLLATDILSCGMGVPGTVSEDGRMAIKVPNLHWENESCAAIFETFTGISTSLVQDSRAAALGEYLMGAAKGRKLVVCVTLGTGIGTGIVLDGRIFTGALGGAGEVGHIICKAGRKVVQVWKIRLYGDIQFWKRDCLYSEGERILEGTIPKQRRCF